MFFDLKLSGRSDCSESVCSAVMLGRLLFCIQLRACRKAAPFDPDWFWIGDSCAYSGQ